MKKSILALTLALLVSGCIGAVIISEFQRWVGTYEYDGVSYRVALVQVDYVDGSSELEYHLVPGDTTNYQGSDPISVCGAASDLFAPLRDVRECHRRFAQQIDALAGPPMMEGGDYG